MTTLVDADTGRVLGVVDGRDSVGVGSWFEARSQAWRDALEVVAIDPSTAFRWVLREHLPNAAISVDAFHLVKLANDMVTAVRQRVIREQKGRLGRLEDPAWVNRRLRLRAGDTLSARALVRLRATLRTDDPTDEIGAAWDIKSNCAAAGKRLTRRSTRAADAAGHLRPGRGHAREQPALAHDHRLVTGDRGTARHRRHQRPNRGREHLDQADQAIRPRPPEPSALPHSCPLGRCRPTRGMNTDLRAGHHAELRRAALGGLTCGDGKLRPESDVLRRRSALHLHGEDSAPVQVRAT
jgi:hypothetical protein